MTRQITRRDAIAGAAALAGGAVALHARAASAAPMAVPEVDRLSVQVLLDSSHDVFIEKPANPLVKVERFNGSTTGRARLPVKSEWGLSLHVESTAAGTTRRQMVDFGTTIDVLGSNLELMKVDVAQLDGLVVSHGHGDHFGGLVGFLERYRDRLRRDIPLVVGGEDNFCWQYAKQPDGSFRTTEVLDRADLKRLGVPWSTAEEPRLIGEHAFSTGRIERASFERVLPNSFVEYAEHDGAGCDAGHFTAAEREGKIQPNQHWNEHATCFNVKGRGLVVISSCGHCGIVNSVRQAQKVSGIEKVHAILGGFHLGPAPAAYVAESVRGIKELKPDLLIPMHCSGVNFVAAAHEMMPDQLVTSTTGSRFTLGV
jgi:7,8-dihydropterin-6-yl-methyl-4-(beta-D-ribofuranosyl)aminobenzene 5'-phosphate synthase